MPWPIKAQEDRLLQNSGHTNVYCKPNHPDRTILHVLCYIFNEILLIYVDKFTKRFAHDQTGQNDHYRWGNNITN